MQLKRIFDFFISFFLLLIFSPLFIILIVLIFLQDLKSPFYISTRVGISKKKFNMMKFRSMRQINSLNHIVSTSNSDPRITNLGRFIRKFKIDEISQLINVLIGNMSLVGPRPNVEIEVDLYTSEEVIILNVKPGITDFASIVFSDLNQILENSSEPNLDYNQLIRPWKSRLAIFYVKNSNFKIDIYIILLTIVSLFSRRKALDGVSKILTKLKASKELIELSRRNTPLIPYPPPGSDKIVTKR
jgi:lipopolysaccharide/colanic/teichoic acid biosynthesis glycosyltransferase